MSKWARKAKKLGLKGADFLASELPRFVQEAARSAEDLRFAFECEGVPMPQTPTYDEPGLTQVEDAYRQNHGSLAEPGLLERLMGLFLGEVAISLHGGRWVIYGGRHHLYSPFVVELAEGNRYVEPLLLCTELANKPHLPGARDGAALIHFVRNLEARATR